MEFARFPIEFHSNLLAARVSYNHYSPRAAMALKFDLSTRTNVWILPAGCE